MVFSLVGRQEIYQTDQLRWFVVFEIFDGSCRSFSVVLLRLRFVFGRSFDSILS